MEQGLSNKMNWNLKNKSTFFLYTLLLLGLGTLFSGMYASTILYDGDIKQLLDHAQVFLETGKLVPYGNVASSGVKIFTPGSFLSAAVALPMYLWNSPSAALILIGVFHFLALLLILKVLLDFYDHRIVFLMLIFYGCNPWQTSEVFLWNPAYLYFFTALHFWSAHQIFKGRSTLGPTVWHVLSLFGALQSHSSFVILGFISLLLFWKKALKVNWYGIVIGLLIGIGSLIPYFIERMTALSGTESTHTSGAFLFRGLIFVYPFLKGIWYWIRQGSFAFPSHLFTDVEFNWVMLVLVGIFSVMSLGFSVFSNYQFIRKKTLTWNLWKFKKEFAENWLVLYIYCAFWALLFVSALIPAEMAYWHVLLLFPISVLVPLTKIYELWNHPKWNRHIPKVLIGILLYLSLFTIATSQQSRKHHFPGNLDKMYHLHHETRESQ